MKYITLRFIIGQQGRKHARANIYAYERSLLAKEYEHAERQSAFMEEITSSATFLSFIAEGGRIE
ncbi:hypothetical protein ACTHO0_25765 [Cytobacillus praedii]|uniref:hypothetical protein n=1 Tax=Cytobacillus praedii TaxID=1742358 RepID=UPI003F81C62A